VIELLAGALLFAYAIAGVHFFQFWRLTRDRLFRHFAVAFWLFAVNQLLVSVPVFTGETRGYVYLLRVLGFVVILIAIIDKNRGGARR
jgi:hypothetical protein